MRGARIAMGLFACTYCLAADVRRVRQQVPLLWL